MNKSELIIACKSEIIILKLYSFLSSKKKNFLREFSFKVIRFFLSKYIYLHNITKILVNIKTKQVFVKHSHKHHTVLKRNSGLVREEKYFISKETFKDLHHIINMKNKKMFKHLKKKLEQEQIEGFS